jgi:hypothetical protein
MANLKITLYDPETNEAKATYTRTFVPWKLLKRSVRLMKKFGADFDVDSMSEDDIDELAALVVDAFGGQFTVDQLGDGADLGEMLTVMTAIMASAGGTSPNPPPQG